MIGDVPYSVGNTVLNTGKKLNGTIVDWALCPSDEFTPFLLDLPRGPLANYSGNRGTMIRMGGTCTQLSLELTALVSTWSCCW